MSTPPDPFANDPWLQEKPKRHSGLPKWLVITGVGCFVLLALLLVAIVASFFMHV